MRRSKPIMGTQASIDIPGCSKEAVFDAVFSRLREIDKRFSPYKKDSELSRYNRGELSERTLSEEMKHVLHACRKWEEKTEGYFSAWYGGECDPSGYVKGWAIAEAGKLLVEQGLSTFCISIGGDILVKSDGGKEWLIGVQHPGDRTKILNKLSISDGAIATSGNYERGKHIANPISGKPADDLLSITVTGPNIVTADVLATAAFAMGQKGVKFVNSQKGYRALAVTGEIVGDDIFTRQPHF
ncbi:MAG TPA: FAD:protein FMN transferase [Candidatus Saccharimonadales bacterium]|nr:FAD:protein FMN transferase [Candidatus Saccharimonadales bacterium]